jgi:membrane-associated phospholipid phosphatase
MCRAFAPASGADTQRSRSIWIYLHDVLHPFVTSSRSNEFIADLQASCGLQQDGSRSGALANILYVYFRSASMAGDEMFSLIPVLTWYVYPLAAPFNTAFGLCLIIAQIFKDMLELPRPPVNWQQRNTENRKCIVKLESAYATEYGFPSSHSVSGCLPVGMLLTLQYRFNIHVPPSWWTVGMIFMLSIPLSRLYMGVHSPCDVVGGTLLGVSCIYGLHNFGESINAVLYKSIPGAWVLLFTAYAFITRYPRVKPWRAGYGTSAQILGTALGKHQPLTARSCRYV